MLVTLAPILTGCGVQFLYNNLDTLVASQLDDYVRLTPEQQAYFDREFQALWRWHRAQELPRYAQDLETWAEFVGDGVTDTEVEHAFSRMRDWWQRVETKGKPASRAFLMRLEAYQVREIAEAFEQENVEWDERGEEDSVESQRRRWAKNFERLLERFTGSLGRQQQDILALGAQEYRPARALWGQYRLVWQREFLSLLAARHDASAFEARFERVFGPQQELYDDALIEAQAHNEALARRLVLAVLQSLNDRQLRKFERELVERAQEFRDLAEARAPRT